MGFLEEVTPGVSYGVDLIWGMEVGMWVESQARGRRHPEKHPMGAGTALNSSGQ